MVQVNRNDLCPCNSGKKYRDCCINEFQIEPAYHSISYPEKFVIGKLLSSPQFSKFYLNEREKISDCIYWTEILDPKNNNRAQILTGIDKNQKMYHVISLRRIPASITEQFSVAHEIAHILIDIKGSLGIRPIRSRKDMDKPTISQKDFHSLASSVNSIFSDVQVNTLLASYGFDWTSHLILDMKKTLEGLKKWNKPLHPYNRLLLVSFYVSNALEYGILYGKGKFEQTQYHKTYLNKLPQIVSDGDEIVEMINDIGYDTPEKHKIIYQYILEKFGLNDEFVID
jgi:hypothetical protein